jgi:hypothetical protein
VTPIWFVVVGGRVVIATGAETVTVRHLCFHPEAVLLFEADRGSEAMTVLRLLGPAVIRPAFPSVGVLIRIVLRHGRPPRGRDRRRSDGVGR